MPGRRSFLAGAVALACACNVHAAARPQASGAATVDSNVAVRQPAIAERPDAVGNAIAGALVDAISRQFGGRAVDLWLDDIHLDDIGPGRSGAMPSGGVPSGGVPSGAVVDGTGGLRIDGKGDWIGFRYRILYDGQSGSAGYPEVHIAGVATDEHNIPNDPQLVAQLEGKVAAALSKALRQAHAQLRLDRVTTVEGSRYLRIDADGVAYLGPDAGTDVQVQALYDRSSRKWLHLHYALDDGTAGSP